LKNYIFDNMRSFILAILLFLISLTTAGQTDSIKGVKYTSDYRFAPGLYLNFSQVKSNNPIPPSRIISKNDPYSIDFFQDLLDQKKISFYDELGSRQDVVTENIWGFSKDGKLFINYNGEFNRIPIVGSICHFIADITVVDTQYDPYYYDRYDYYYSSSYYRRPYNRTTRSKEMRQYLLNFETGEVSTYERENVAVLLMEDPELYDEYSSLRKRKQKDLMFFFVRRYNERNPLYIAGR